MPIEQLKTAVRVDPCFRRNLEVFVWIEHENGHHSIMEPAVFRKLTEGESAIIPQPSFPLSQTAAQQLADQLWAAGVRPSESVGSAGAMAAVQAHLKDARAMVSHLLKVDLNA